MDKYGIYVLISHTTGAVHYKKNQHYFISTATLFDECTISLLHDQFSSVKCMICYPCSHWYILIWICYIELWSLATLYDYPQNLEGMYVSTRLCYWLHGKWSRMSGGRSWIHLNYIECLKVSWICIRFHLVCVLWLGLCNNKNTSEHVWNYNQLQYTVLRY